jgi:hypothetical protein
MFFSKTMTPEPAGREWIKACCRNSKRALRVLLLWSAIHALNAHGQTEDLLKELKIPIWTEVIDLRGLMGYKDNVLLSYTNAHGSPFWVSGADVLVFRLPINGWQFNFVASGTDTRYFSGQTVNSEQTAVAALKLTRIYGDGWSSGLGANYAYENQVMDLTATSTNLTPITKVLGNTFGADWFARKDFRPYWAQFDVACTRQLLEAPLDNYWQLGPKLTLDRKYGSGSDLALSGQWNYLRYDTTPDLTAQGQQIPNTHERVQAAIVDLDWRHDWDASNHWHSITGVGYQSDKDNSSGYFNFSYYSLSTKLEYGNAAWKISAVMRGGYYDYPMQQVSPTDLSKRQRLFFAAGLHAERKLSKHLKLFADYNYENSQSDDYVDHYQINIAGIGLEWGF